MSFTRRNPSCWQLRSRNLALGDRTLVMGVLNITPDSFSGDGLLAHQDSAIDRGLAMLDAGAAILDVGGESTRPGKRKSLPAEEEIERVLPVISGILKRCSEAAISIDTYKAETARAAVAAGAEIVNDVSGFLWDEAMASTCAMLASGVILMHTRGRPEEWSKLPRLNPADAVALVKSELRARLNAGLSAGVSAERIVLDPGIGFGKVLREQLCVISWAGRVPRFGSSPALRGLAQVISRPGSGAIARRRRCPARRARQCDDRRGNGFDSRRSGHCSGTRCSRRGGSSGDCRCDPGSFGRLNPRLALRDRVSRGGRRRRECGLPRS